MFDSEENDRFEGLTLKIPQYPPKEYQFLIFFWRLGEWL